MCNPTGRSTGRSASPASASSMAAWASRTSLSMCEGRIRQHRRTQQHASVTTWPVETRIRWRTSRMLYGAAQRSSRSSLGSWRHGSTSSPNTSLHKGPRQDHRDSRHRSPRLLTQSSHAQWQSSFSMTLMPGRLARQTSGSCDCGHDSGPAPLEPSGRPGQQEQMEERTSPLPTELSVWPLQKSPKRSRGIGQGHTRTCACWTMAPSAQHGGEVLTPASPQRSSMSSGLLSFTRYADNYQL